MVPVTDLNAMAVIEYAVSSLGVRHIIVCGHYHCGGVRAALEGHQAGAVALWLQPLRNLADAHREELDALPSDDARWDRLCELNVAAQVQAVAPSEIVEAAWERGAELAVHGWIYDLEDGLLRDLEVTVGGAAAGRLMRRAPRPAGRRAAAVGARRPVAAPAAARRAGDDAPPRRPGVSGRHPRPSRALPRWPTPTRTACSPSRSARHAEAVGWVGYWESEWRGEAVWECGWSVLPEAQGRGIATAAAALMIDDVRRRGAHRHLHAFPSVDNAASNALCRTLGFELLGEVEVEYPKGRLMRSNDWRLDRGRALATARGLSRPSRHAAGFPRGARVGRKAP